MRLGYQTTLRNRATIRGVGSIPPPPLNLSFNLQTSIWASFFCAPAYPAVASGCSSKALQRDAYCALHNARGCVRRERQHGRASSGALSACRSITFSSKSTVPRRRSWTAPQLISSAPSIRPGEPSSRACGDVKILKPVRVSHDGGYAEFLPAERGFRLDIEIDFDSRVIGRQRFLFDLDPVKFHGVAPPV